MKLSQNIALAGGDFVPAHYITIISRFTRVHIARFDIFARAPEVYKYITCILQWIGASDISDNFNWCSRYTKLFCRRWTKKEQISLQFFFEMKRKTWRKIVLKHNYNYLNTSHSSTHTQTQYILGQHDSGINIQTVHTATTQTDFMRIVGKNDFSQFHCIIEQSFCFNIFIILRFQQL